MTGRGRGREGTESRGRSLFQEGTHRLRLAKNGVHGGGGGGVLVSGLEISNGDLGIVILGLVFSPVERICGEREEEEESTREVTDIKANGGGARCGDIDSDG